MSLSIFWVVGLMALKCSSQSTDNSGGAAPASPLTANFTEVICPRIYHPRSGGTHARVYPEQCSLRCKGSNFDPMGGLTIKYKNGSSLFDLPTSRPETALTFTTDGFSVTTSGSVVTATAVRPMDFVTDTFVCTAKSGTAAITQEIRVADLPITRTPGINPTRTFCSYINSAVKIPRFTSLVEDTLFQNPNTYSRTYRELSVSGRGCPDPTDIDLIVSVHGDIYILPFRESHVAAGCTWTQLYEKHNSNPSRYFRLEDVEISFHLYDTVTFNHENTCTDIRKYTPQLGYSRLVHVTESPAFMSANSTGGKFYIECIYLPRKRRRIQSTSITWKHNNNVIDDSNSNFQVDSGAPYYTMRMGITIAESNAGTYSCRPDDGSSRSIEVRYARYPEITDLSTQSSTYDAGETAVFDCSWTSNPRILLREKVQWIHNGNYLTTGTSATISTDTEAQTSQLTIIGLQSVHTGYVSCLVENEVGNVQKDYFIRVASNGNPPPLDGNQPAANRPAANRPAASGNGTITMSPDGAHSIYENTSRMIVILTSAALLLLHLVLHCDC